MSPLDADLSDFYERSYRAEPDSERYGRWRQVGALNKADHIVRLARVIGFEGGDVAEVGCGDGAILDDLGARGFGHSRVGYEISSAAAALAAERAGVTRVHLFDGRHVPVPDGAYDLVFASHVLEHVSSPGDLVRELARIGHAVIVECPLEANLSARRPGARAASKAAGHIQRFSRDQLRSLVREAGLEIRAELSDPLPLAVHMFGRDSASARLIGYAKWATRSVIGHIPIAGERLITLHYALAATHAGRSRR
jgi:SAM-dependent methyltransferase